MARPRKPMDGARVVVLMRGATPLELARRQIAMGYTMLEVLRDRRPRVDTVELRNMEYDIARRVALLLGVRLDNDGQLKQK